jgi:4-oxalmesaconate hydratase
VIIDCHTHYHAAGIAAGAFSVLYGHTIVGVAPSKGDDELHLKLMEERGYAMQFLTQPPFTQVHDQDARLGLLQAQAFNDAMAKAVQEQPKKFRALASLPIQDVPTSVKEMERAVRELGMIGAMVNPDPSRRGTGPTQDEEYWYPIYEKACELDVPIFIHPGSSALPRHRNYSLALHCGFLYGETDFILTFIFGRVFDRYPNLKVLVSHGGGAVPYQYGRFQASTEPDLRLGTPRTPLNGTFVDNLRKLYFDTCIYNQEGIECLIKVVGADRCLFGTETPGMGMARRPDGRSYDNVEDYVNGIEWLSAEDRQKVFADNAQRLFKLEVGAAV